MGKVLPFPQKPAAGRFTTKAAKRWAEIPAQTQKLLLANVYCWACRGSVQIADYDAVIEKGDLVLRGRCGTCGEPVARVIEAPES
jgi:hypothetical protein